MVSPVAAPAAHTDHQPDATVLAFGDSPVALRLHSLGLDGAVERAYLAALERPAWTVRELADRLGLDPTRTRRVVDRLAGLGLVGAGRDRVRPLDPQVGLAALLAQREADLARSTRDLESSRLAAADIAVDFAGRGGVAVHTTRSPAAVTSTIESLLRSATSHVIAMTPSATAHDDPLSTVRHLDARQLRAGVRCRVVFPDAARLDPTLSRRLLQLARDGVSVRTAAVVPVPAIVVDGALTALAADRGGVSVLRLAGAATATLDLFERVWQGATPLTLSATTETSGFGQRERELLALLAEGATDESAAVRLGVSVRTVRRMVSEVMRRLGARSRFQAGMKAAERGWFESR